MIRYRFYKSGFWLRIGKRGISFAIDRPKLFSERYGYNKVYRLGRLSFKWLPPL